MRSHKFHEGNGQIVCFQRTGNISYVVPHVIGDRGGVTGIVFRDTVDDLSDQVGTDIGGFGINTTTHTTKLCVYFKEMKECLSLEEPSRCG